MSVLADRLLKLGVVLPPVASPVAAYIPALIDRGIVRTSGQIPLKNGELVLTGAVGEGGTSPDEAFEAARICALNAVAAAADVAGGIDKLASVIKVTGFVSSLPSFTGQAGVVNGASEFLGELFDSAHVRSAVGVAALPLDASVEIEVEFALVNK